MQHSPSIVAETEYFTVLDHVLAPEQCDRLWNYLQVQPLRRVDTLGLHGHWLIEDSGVLRGPTAGWGHTFDAQFPTETPLDDVMKAVVGCAEMFAPTIGHRGTDWEIFSAFATIYAAGQGLVWHRDSEDNAGSYVYYAHPRWNVEWGGELLLAHERNLPREYGVFLHRLRPTRADPKPLPWQSHFDNDDANELLMERGLGSYVVPKPNRMVVIRGGTPHAIAKIRPSAGRYPRASVGGFFKKKDIALDQPLTPWTM